MAQAKSEFEEGKARGVLHPEGMHKEEDKSGQQQQQAAEQIAEQVGSSSPVTVTGESPPATGSPTSARDGAIQRAINESTTIGGAPTEQVQRGSRRPILDVTGKTHDELVEMLKKLLDEQEAGRGANGGVFPLTKAVRWNNGEEPNVQNGEIVSARDTGSISAYGFARRPLTLYASQWVGLAHYMPDILRFIEANLEGVNGYSAERLGNRSKELSAEDLQAALALFC